MCGIVGYSGKKAVAEIIMKGLSKLEYRGYDSAGIAVCLDGKTDIFKTKGRLSVLQDLLDKNGVPEGCVGIGHTRWATHGEPSDRNSHPHRFGKVTLVHNGIIENYLHLRQSAEAKGAKFASDTDTEAAAYVIDSCYDGDPIKAISKALPQLHGSYAFGIIFSDKTDTIYAVRRDSPLIAAQGDGECFIASDIPAILSYTRDYYLMDTDEIAELKNGVIRFFDLSGNDITNSKKLLHADFDIEAAEKGGYPHFMLKEIYEQPDTLKRLIAMHTEDGAANIFKSEIPDTSDIKRIFIVGCGSAMHAGLLGKYSIEHLCRIPVSVSIASEFRYDDPMVGPGDTVFIISQSGETADSLAALRLSHEKGAKVCAIVNVVGSSIAREADEVIYTRCGPEIAVATTKAFTAQVLIMYLLTARLSYDRKTVSEQFLKDYLIDMAKLPDYATEVLTDKYVDLYKKFAEYNKPHGDYYIIGRGQDYATGCEGAMKIKEVSYMHCESYAAGELKHGTISLVTPGVPCMAIITDPDIAEKTVSNVKEVRARGGHVVLVSSCTGENADICDEYIKLPQTNKYLMPIVAIIPVQTYAYYTAVLRGCDVDKPRNLAKSVTVE